MSSTPNPTPNPTSSSSSSSPFSSDNKVLFPGYKHVERFGPDGDYEYKRKRKHKDKHKHKGKGRGADEDEEIEDEGEGEEEIEEEECYITLDLSNVDQTLASSCSSYRLVGLDTPTPLFQLSKTKTIMKGQLRTLIGTELIFKHASNPDSGSGSGPGSEDPNTTTSNTTPNTTNTSNTTNTNSNIQYFTKTSNRIHFREVLLQPTKAKSGDESNTDEELHAVAAAATAVVAGRGTSTTNENTEPESGLAETTPRPSNAAQDTSRSQVSEFVSESQAEQDIQPYNRVGDSLLAVQTYRPMDVD